MEPPAIELVNVSTTYEGEQRPAIKNINLRISAGEVVYVAGPNGAGKTTLLETINGLLTPVRGSVYVLGQDVSKRGRLVRREIGYVPQDYASDPWEPFRAIDVVLMGLYGKLGLFTKPSKEDYEKALWAMELLEIDHLAEKPVGKLSGGQQQRVMIARAIAKKPKILLLDEPFSSQDLASRSKVMEVIEDLHKSWRLTTVVVSHNLSETLELCNRVVLMAEGRIFAEAGLDEALELLGSALVKSARVEAVRVA